MSKNGKILLVLLIAALFLVLYLIINSRPVAQNKDNAGSQIKKVDLMLLENDYKKEAKAILQEYSELIKKDDLQAEELRAVKDKLLALKVPAKFKDLHLSLVLAVAKMSESVNEADAKEKEAGAKLIQDLKAKYVWLN